MNIAIPAATLVAMLRHDLYDVDRAVVAAAVYPVLAFLVVAGHATVSSAVALAVGADSTAPAVLATVVVVVLLLPARALLLRFLGRRLHPRRGRGRRRGAGPSPRSRGCRAPSRAGRRACTGGRSR